MKWNSEGLAFFVNGEKIGSDWPWGSQQPSRVRVVVTLLYLDQYVEIKD